jgi:hypothetical protein
MLDFKHVLVEKKQTISFCFELLSFYLNDDDIEIELKYLQQNFCLPGKPIWFSLAHKRRGKSFSGSTQTKWLSRARLSSVKPSQNESRN